MSPVTAAYLALAFAIVFEVVGTSFLMKSEQFTRWLPSVLVVVFYLAAFYLLSISLKSIPLGIAYALWAGLGIVLTTLIGAIVFKQSLDPAAVIGIAMIVGGVVVINTFSKTAVA
ncbi:multidrug efflux SMR transporter [Wenzhouxiangella sp. XN79A]|uniref:DMT family transporter n=1 Tax=Wenzhouxiangella sp. XN79A TaxID=2724193 RepID=UPI00144ADB1B|nr:multidrug efflux SMR transporter [Wenzhouxiangella sp. XN79A]NKI34764.1 multidrug efflux SMR transporter [Wenzhouxiangella sp. XN79A]